MLYVQPKTDDLHAYAPYVEISENVSTLFILLERLNKIISGVQSINSSKIILSSEEKHGGKSLN